MLLNYEHISLKLNFVLQGISSENACLNLAGGEGPDQTAPPEEQSDLVLPFLSNCFEILELLPKYILCKVLTLCMLGNFVCFCHLLIYFKVNFFKNFFQEYHQCQTV